MQSSDARKRLAVFVSGSGRTLDNLLALIDRGALDARVVLVVASRECRGAEIGREAGIRTEVQSRPWREGQIREMLDGAGLAEAGWVVLAGYTKLIEIPDIYAGRVVNIHPALLPAHGGKGMYGSRVHAAVIEAGERESGCSVHLCDGVYDRGEVLAQARCPVEAGDTPEALADRVFELELELYPRVIAGLIRGDFDEQVERARQAVGGAK